MTPRQRDVALAIRDLSLALGYPPTIRELCNRLNTRSTNGMAEHLELLAAKGYVWWAPGKARTLRVTVEGEYALGVRQ